jgi:hypothetical protein
VPNPAVLRSGEEADDGLTEAREAYARFEDIKGKLHLFIYEEADATVSGAMRKDEPVETGLLRMMSREDGLAESESAGEDSRQSLGKTVAGDRDNERMETRVGTVAVAESAEERSTAPKSTRTGTREEGVEAEGTQQLSAPRRRLRDRLRLRMGRCV